MKCGDPNNPGGAYLIAHTGLPCKNDVSPGKTRCHLHGGAGLSAKIKAEQMMAQCRMPAIEALFSILAQFSRASCSLCGFPVGDADEKRMVIQACRTVLDRAGLGPSAQLTITPQSDGDVNLDLLTDLERADLLHALARVRDIKAILKIRMLSMTANPDPQNSSVVPTTIQ